MQHVPPSLLPSVYQGTAETKSGSVCPPFIGIKRSHNSSRARQIPPVATTGNMLPICHDGEVNKAELAYPLTVEKCTMRHHRSLKSSLPDVSQKPLFLPYYRRIHPENHSTDTLIHTLSYLQRKIRFFRILGNRHLLYMSRKSVSTAVLASSPSFLCQGRA